MFEIATAVVSRMILISFGTVIFSLNKIFDTIPVAIIANDFSVSEYMISSTFSIRNIPEKVTA